MIYSVHQPQYLPWIGFFDKVDKSDCFVFLDNVQYKHREFQNRNKIRTKDGWIWLTVPVLSRRGEKVREVRIDDHRPWRSDHLKSLKSWYARSEFFDRHIGFFEETYAKTWERLVDLNVAITAYVLKSLGIETKILFESELSIAAEKTDRIIEIGRKIGAETYFSGAGGRDYLQEEKFCDAGLGLVYQEFAHPVYRQPYAAGEADFIANLSIVDLLFNEGDRSLDIIRSVNPSIGSAA